MPPASLSEEEAADLALSLTVLERAVIGLCAKGKAWQYRTIAEKISVSYSEVQAAGQKFQRARLAHISVIPYDGSRMFLNDRGEQVKRAVEILANIERTRLHRTGL